MQRRYFVRQKEIKVEEIEGVVAVRADPAAHIDVQRQLEVMRVAPPVGNVDAAALKPFERANWRFVADNEPIRSALEAHQAIDGSNAIGRLFRANGSLAIGTNRLTVQLDAQLSEDQCQAALSDHALELVRKLARQPHEVLARAPRQRRGLRRCRGPASCWPASVPRAHRSRGPDDPQYAQQWQLNNTGQGGGGAPTSGPRKPGGSRAAQASRGRHRQRLKPRTRTWRRSTRCRAFRDGGRRIPQGRRGMPNSRTALLRRHHRLPSEPKGVGVAPETNRCWSPVLAIRSARS